MRHLTETPEPEPLKAMRIQFEKNCKEQNEHNKQEATRLALLISMPTPKKISA